MSLLGSTLHEMVQDWWRRVRPAQPRVVLMDTDVESLTRNARALRDEGFSCTMASDRAKVLTCLNDQDYALAILALPALDADDLQFVSNLHELQSGCQLLVLSSPSHTDRLDEAMGHGACRLLVRTSTSESIVAAAREALANRNAPRPIFRAAA